MKTRKHIEGLTLLELLIVLAILAILVGVALPSFTGTIGASGVSGTNKSFMNALALAKSEAVARNRTVSVCGANTAMTDCLAAGWNNGWIVFVDNNDDADGDAGSIDAGATPDEVLQVFSPSNDTAVTVSANILRYDSRGFGANGAARTVKFCPESNDVSLARGIEIFVTGSTRLVTTGLACP